MKVDTTFVILAKDQIGGMSFIGNRVCRWNCLNPQPYTIHINMYYSSI